MYKYLFCIFSFISSYGKLFAQKQFVGELIYKIQADKGSIQKYATLMVSDSKILYTPDSLDVVDGFNKHLLVIEKGKAIYYIINETLRVALRQEFNDSCSLYTYESSSKKGYGKSKSEGNPTKLKEKDFWFSALYTYNNDIQILSNISPVKCFPVFFIMNGKLIEESESVYRAEKREFKTHTKLVKILERQIEDSVFDITSSISVEDYSHMKRSQISYLYYLKKK